jgi:hypothetical protein
MDAASDMEKIFVMDLFLGALLSLGTKVQQAIVFDAPKENI